MRGFLWLAEELEALQGLCPIELVTVSLNPKLHAVARKVEIQQHKPPADNI